MSVIPSIAQDIPLETAGQLGGQTPAAAAPLGFFDKVRLGYKGAGAGPDWGLNQMVHSSHALAEVRDALKARGIEPIDPYMTTGNQLPGESVNATMERRWRELFAQAAKVRASDAKFLPDFAPVVDQSSFQSLVRNRRKREMGEVESQAPDGLGLPGFIGAIGHGFTDPTSYIPVGGAALKTTSAARAIIGTAIREAVANMAFTIVTEPLVRVDAKSLGVERTISDTLFDIGVAGAAGGGIGATGAALGEALARRGKTVDQAADGSDAEVAEIFAESVPPEARTPDEQAAVSAIQRTAEVKATSPFVDGPEGDDAHFSWLDDAMRNYAEGKTFTRGEAKPVARETVAKPEDVAGARMPARELLKAKIHRAEATATNDYNSASGATGPYQFVANTWVSLFKRRYPNDTRSFEQIAALRRDPHLNDVLINDLISENSAALRHAGFEATAPNLYLAHFLGHDRAVKVLHAAGDTPLGRLLPDEYFHDNPWMKREWAASKLVGWADKKMGGDGATAVAAAPGAPESAPAAAIAEAVPEVDIPTGRFDVEALYGDVGMTDRPVLKPDMFDSPEAHAAAQVRFERERDAAEGFAPVMGRAEAFSPYEHFADIKRYKGKLTAEAMGEALGGLTPDEVRKAVRTMQSLDRSSPFILARERGAPAGSEPTRIMRRPAKPIKANETLLEYLSRTVGSLKDEGGDLAAMGAGDWHKGGPFRRKLIDNERGVSLDEAYQRAIDADYFPEHNAASRLNGGSYEDLPDLADFLEAIDEEMRGRPRVATGDLAAAELAAKAAKFGEEAPEPDAVVESAEQRAERLFELTGHNQEALAEAAGRRGITLTDDEMLVDASELMDRGMEPDDAIDNAALASAYRSLDDAARETGNSTYAIDAHERFAGDDGFPEERGSDGAGGEADAGGRGPEGVESDAGQAGNKLAQPAHDPAAGEFADPVGKAAEAQADSYVHDLQMEAGPQRVFHGGNLDGEVRAPLFVAEDRAMADTYALDRGGAVTELTIAPRKVASKADIDTAAAAVGVEPAVIKTMTGGMLLDQAFNDQADQLIARLRSEGFDAAKFEDFAVDADSKTGTAYAVLDPDIVSPEGTTYRLDEEGGESDLASILAEIDEAQKAAAEMRACLKPKGGDE